MARSGRIWSAAPIGDGGHNLTSCPSRFPALNFLVKFRVQVRSAGGSHGSRYRVVLPKAVRTSCACLHGTHSTSQSRDEDVTLRPRRAATALQKARHLGAAQHRRVIRSPWSLPMTYDFSPVPLPWPGFVGTGNRKTHFAKRRPPERNQQLSPR
jgi:hypothetical protein